MKLTSSVWLEPHAIQVIVATACFMLVATTDVVAANKYRKSALAAASRVNVHVLDAALPRAQFATWFCRVIGRNAKIEWSVNDCGEQTGTPGDKDDIPMCVDATARVGNAEVVVTLSVGSFNAGVRGQPEVFAAVVNSEGRMYYTVHLSELPQLIEQHK